MRWTIPDLVMPATLAALVMGCSSAGASAGPSAGLPSPSGPSSSASPTATAGAPADQLVLRVAADGGFVPPGFLVTRLPQMSIFADGRAIEPGAVAAIYPGPPTSPLFVHRLDSAALDRVRAAARSAGLDGRDRSYSAVAVADVETTVLTYVDAVGRHVLSIYALGFPPGPQASPDERAARQAATLLLASVQAILAESSAEGYSPSGFRIYATRQDAPSTEMPPPNLLDWPADLPVLSSLQPPASNAPAGACGVIDGARLPTFTALLARATQITRYREAGREWTLLVRPLLPDEAHGCP